MEITIEEIQNKFESLPENLKWAILAAKIDEKITTIGQLHGLNVEQMGQLSLETYMVVLNYTHPDKFEASLKGSLNLPDEKNREIVIEINNKILRAIKENLMSQSEEKESEVYEKIQEPTEEAIETQKKEEINETASSVKDIENKKIMETIFSQKLSGAFKTPTVTTEYSLNNLSKKEEKTIGSNKDLRAPTSATIKLESSDTKSVSPSYSAQEDPYRMKPE